MLRVSIFCIFICFTSVALSQSVLSEGSWFKIGITEDGVYKIDRTLLEGLGMNNPGDAIKVYGIPGGPLAQDNGTFRYDGPQELPTMKVGLEDGSFDAGDYLIFYGQGPDRLTFIDGTATHVENVYADTAYFFIQTGRGSGLEIGNQEPVTGSFTNITTYEDLFLFEENNINILKSGTSRGGSGREWFGQLLNINPQIDIPFEVDDYLGTGQLIISSLGQSDGPSAVGISINGEEIGEQTLTPVAPPEADIYDALGIVESDTFAFNLDPGSDPEISLEFRRLGADFYLARLNKIILQLERQLTFTGSPFSFQSLASLQNDNTTYRISGNSAPHVWKTTDPINPLKIAVSPSSGDWAFHENSEDLEAYFAFDPDNLPRPVAFGSLENQNIKGLNPQDGIIITYGPWLSEAERLADFHRSHDGLDVVVITIDQVYNEFASGRQDISAIRDAVRYFYSRSERFRYLLLFGDCSYDYKNNAASNTNHVPTYQSINSVHPIFSYSSDDFFGFLEDDEGSWSESDAGDHTLDIGVGRLPVKSLAEAENVVDKIIRYATAPELLGNWKNTVTYVVDDGDRNTHMRHAEQLSEILAANRASVSFDKQYLDATNQIVGASTESAPTFSESVVSALEAGSFLVNYIGHGNEFQWMDENILNDENIDAMTNRFNLPIYVTATCQFGRYDDPDFFSGSERLLLNPNGGAIALLTTTRPVFSSSNLLVNEAFHEAIFEEDGEMPRLGDIIRKTKNESLRGVRNRNFALLGDPFLTLDYPDYDVALSSINGKEIAATTDTLSALEEISVSGAIRNANGNIVNNFNGTVEITLFDNEKSRRTLGQESAPFQYITQDNSLYRGSASVSNGTFTHTFIVTRNSSYRFEPGKFQFYAMDEVQNLDASGASTAILLGGTSDVARMDNTGPNMTLFVNDVSFTNGDVVDRDGVLIAQIADESGINISRNGINQNITLRLNSADPIIVNEYYTAATDDAFSGTFVYPLENLAPGSYTATIKVWDLYNNSSSTSVEYVVSDEVRITIDDLVNYPNPASETIFFSFNHSRPGEPLTIDLEIFNMHGRVIEQLEYEIDNSGGTGDQISWNIDDGLEAGMYFYRLTVKSALDGAVGGGIGRLILN